MSIAGHWSSGQSKILWLPGMFRQSVRRFATTTFRSAEAATSYNVRVSKAQGSVNGLTEGMVARSMALAYASCAILMSVDV